VGVGAAFGAALGEALRAEGVAAEVAEGDAGDLVVVDSGATPAGETERLLAQRGSKVILLSGQEDKDNINLVLARHPVCHVIGANGRAVMREARITIQKLLTGDVWGLGRYFDDPSVVETREIRAADQIDESIETLLGHLDLKGSFAATHEYLQLTANELCTNAAYNAPVGEDGKPKYEQTDRKVKIKLTESEAVRLSVCQDEERIGIAVEDQFGRLDREKIVRHLVKCVNNTQFIDNKKGGAGAGIYLAFYTASQFIVNIEPGRRLEAICILERTKRYKDHMTRVTSFNYFKVPSVGTGKKVA